MDHYLVELKKKEFLESKRRQQLRQNNEELRLLENQLRAAHVSFQLSKQRANILHQKESELHLRKKESDRFKSEQFRLKNAELIERTQKQIQKDQFRTLLLNQITEQVVLRKQKFEELMRNCQNTKKVLNEITKENLAEHEDLQYRKLMAIHEMKELSRKQKELKLREEATARIEKVNLEKISNEKARTAKQQRDEIRKKQDEKTAINDEIGRKIYNIENEKRFREELLNELRIQEKNVKDDLQLRAILEKKIKDKIQFQNDCVKYQHDVVYLKTQQKKEDLQFREEQIRLMAERDKIEQLSEEKKRLKQTIHRRAVQEMLKEKNAQRAQEAADQVYQHNVLELINKKEQRDIEEERLRMLQCEPSNILKFLPAAVLNRNKTH